MSILHKANAPAASDPLNGGEVALNSGQRREYEVLFPARELVRRALIGAGFTDVVIEADMPRQQAMEPQPERPQEAIPNILNDTVEYTAPPYLEQEAPVAQAIMQQTVSSPEMN